MRLGTSRQRAERPPLIRPRKNVHFHIFTLPSIGPFPQKICVRTAHPLPALKLSATLGLKGGRLTRPSSVGPPLVPVPWCRRRLEPPGPPAGRRRAAPSGSRRPRPLLRGRPACGRRRAVLRFRRSPGPKPASRPGSGVRRGPCVPPAPLSPSPVPSPCAAGPPVVAAAGPSCLSRDRHGSLAMLGPFQASGGRAAPYPGAWRRHARHADRPPRPRRA